MNLGNLLIVIFILLLFICFSIKNTMVRPLTLITTVILLVLFLVYLEKESFSVIMISESKLDDINLENQQYLIQRNLLKNLNKSINDLYTVIQRIS